MNKINRRALIASTAALASTSLPSLPLQAAEADAEIARLYAAYVDAEERDTAAYAAFDDAEIEAQHAVQVPLPLWPAEVLPDGELRASRPAHPALAMDRDAIEALVAQLPEGERKGELCGRLKALQDWQTECSRQRVAHHVDDLEGASEAASDVRDEAWAALMDAPATSIIGIALKLAAVLRSDPTAQMVWTGAKSPWECQAAGLLLSARADALRLAGLPHTYGTDEPQGEYVDTEETEEEGA